MPLEKQTNGTPLETEMVGMPLKKQTDTQVNSGSLDTSVEHNLAQKSDKSDDMNLEKESDGATLEKQTSDQVIAPTTAISPFLEHNLSKKSEKVGHTPLENQMDSTPLEKEANGAPLDKKTDEQVAVSMSGISTSVVTSVEHNLAEKSKVDDTLLLKQTDNTNLEKEADAISLGKQTDDQVASPMVANSAFLEATYEQNLAGKSDKADDTQSEKQTKGTLCGKETDATPFVSQTDVQAIVPLTHLKTDSDQRCTSREMNEPVTPLENMTGSVATDMKGPHPEDIHIKTPLKEDNTGEYSTPIQDSNRSFIFEPYLDGDDSGSEEEQAAFMKELENFYRERRMDFKPPKFYGEPLNCLRLWRAVTRLGGYDQVTACKLWRQVGESFNPPKTCTTISWSFRMFYEKALLEYEKHKFQTGELKAAVVNPPGVMNDDNSAGGNQASGSGRAKRDAAARAMQVWHTQLLLDTGEVGDQIIKDKNLLSSPGKDKQLMVTGKLKRKSSIVEHTRKVVRIDSAKPQGDIIVADVGAPADWVKINIQRTNEFYEVYALVPGLLREEVQVQSDPAGRLIISGEPEYPDNPWGVTPFKKVITLPTRIDPYQTSAVVTLHGQLFVRAPIDLSDV
ncbi:AT-rich interactive domain-containing protein 5-like isoform X1 [Canna indica]|uniref:AT-rich interactive domain-containing protein 5-like isoform X1 n=1 Tax=Canna indica TaxID=4628 RepID=A0AAQ3JTT8_9LILI|nr:AT-rich interactive domain-containing protein 5-like isoform X1 [Canna indica]